MIKILWKIFKIGIVSEKLPTMVFTKNKKDNKTLENQKVTETIESKEVQEAQNSAKLQSQIINILGRALTIRQIDAGSCNACELEIHAMNNPYYNIEGAGIKFVASPRHADMLMITGVVTKNMENALKIAYECTPAPKLIVAVGDCACNGGVFLEYGNNYALSPKLEKIIHIDAKITGCPPTPNTIIREIIKLIQK